MRTKVSSYDISTTDSRMKDAYASFYADPRLVVKCDLPFRQIVPAPASHQSNYLAINREIASRTINKFLSTLNRRYFKNAYRRHNKRLVSFVSIESDFVERHQETRHRTYQNTHAHIALSKPDHISIEDFITDIKTLYPLTNEFSAPITETKHRSTGKVEKIDNVFSVTRYALKHTIDNLDLPNLNR